MTLLTPLRASATATLDQCVDSDTCARILGVSVAWLEKGRTRGDSPLRHVKIGRLVKYRLSEIERYLQAQERTSTADNGTRA